MRRSNLFYVISFFLVLIGVSALSADREYPVIDYCHGDKNVEKALEGHAEDVMTYCHVKVDSYYSREQKGEIEFVALYYLEGRDNYFSNGEDYQAPMVAFKLATNHTYLEDKIIQGIQRDALSVCHMFEQIRKKRLPGNRKYDLSKLTTRNDISVSVLIGGSESNSFLYTYINPYGVSIEMNNTDYCDMRGKIEAYLDSIEAYKQVKTRKVQIESEINQQKQNEN